MSNVRIHSNDVAQNAAKSLHARAFTHQNNIFLGGGQSEYDLRLMAHEGTHVLQQAKGKRAIQCDYETATTRSGPAEAEASLPAHPSRAPHEIVIMSGGPTSNRMDPDHDDHPWNYATAARARIERFIESAFGSRRLMIPDDTITWVVMRPPYRYRALEDGKSVDEYTNRIANFSLPKLRADWDRLRTSWVRMHPEQGGVVPTGAEVIQLHFVDSSADFVVFMNEGSAGAGRAAMSYAGFPLASKPIGRFEYFGHGVPGQLWFSMGWDHIASKDQTFSTDDISLLDANIFVGEAEYRSWSCNTARPKGVNATSFAQAWVERFGGRFVGAVGRTTYAFITDPSNPRAEVFLSREEPAYWATVESVGQRPPAAEPVESHPGWVHESELPPETTEQTEAPSVSPEWSGMATRARSSAEARYEELVPEMVCRLDIVPYSEPAEPGDPVCTDEGAGRFDLGVCTPGESQTGARGGIAEPETTSPGADYYRVHEIPVGDPRGICAPGADEPAWDPFLQAIADQAYRETLDTDSLPGTGANLINLASEIRARSQGFHIGVVERNGRVYYKIYGSRGAHSGIPGRWYAARNLPGTSSELARLVSPRAGLSQGLRGGAGGLSYWLTVGGRTLDYAIDPEKEFGSDYAVDIAFDLVKTAGSGAAAGAVGAWATGVLAGGALGATIGSAAPIVGTVVGFVVGVLVAMAIEFFIGDFRQSIKSWLRSRHDIRATGTRAPGGRGSRTGAPPRAGEEGIK
jgi:hypothetical protein